VPVLDSVFDKQEAAIVFPYLPGQSLAERLRDRGRLEPREAVAVALDIADVLASAHAAGVVHRDIKPGNILLCEDGSTRLLDFGISQAVDTAADDGTDPELTGSGMAIGTLPYMAPEQLTGGTPTPAADIYALGVVLYEMLAGSRPFHGRSPSEQLALQAEPPMAPDGPAALTQVAMSALDPVPERRPDATQVGRALGAWLDGRTETDAPTAPVAVVAPLRPEPRVRPATLAGAAVLGLALVIVAGLALAGAVAPATDTSAPTGLAGVAAAPSSSPVPSPTPSSTASPQPTPAAAVAGQVNPGPGDGHGGGKHKHHKHHHGHGHHRHGHHHKHH
jgi:serine/threonine protein kinase